jgi:hypothetical protein
VIKPPPVVGAHKERKLLNIRPAMPGFVRRRLLSTVAEVIIIALLLAAAMYLYRPGFYTAGSRMDEATLLVYPEMMLKGKVAYRDFETFYGPANLCTLAAVFRACGTTIMTERTVGLFYRIALFAALYVAARKWGKIAAVGVVFIAMLAILHLWLFAIAWIMALALAVSSTTLLARSLTSSGDGRIGFVLAGFVGGVACLFRIDMAPAVIVSASVMLILLNSKRWWLWIVGAAAGCMPLLWWLVQAGYRSMIENLFLYPVIFSNQARRLPLFGEGAEVAPFLSAAIGAVALTVGCGVIAVWKKRGDSDNIVLLAFGCFGALVLPQTLQRADSYHAAMSAPLTIAFLPVVAAAIIKLADKPALSPLFAGLTTAACFSALLSIDPHLVKTLGKIVREQLAISEIPEYVARSGDRKFPLASPVDARAVTTICEALVRRSQSGQRLFVGPLDLRRTNYNDVYFYYLLPQLEPASYFIEMNPLSANRVGSRLANDIETADWLILDSQLNQSSREPNLCQQLGSDKPARVIQDHFIQVGHLDQFSIFRRRTDL